VVVEARDRRVALVAERVVGDDDPARGELGQDGLVVVDVALLVGVDEREVDAVVDRRDRGKGRAEPDGDPAVALDVAVGERRALGVDLAR
jgi:hypothetical protein